MNGGAYRHIGGAVVGDHGAVSLARARQLVRFYGREALHCRRHGQRAVAEACARRALALNAAVSEAAQWRRAAGWRAPEGADIRA
ncbi:MAG TPA: hypothetical protein VFE03_00055 [Caulobacteraceae bacterium]|nr:hypothetical protein [Caulobacteraceae bacterium]